MAKKINIFVKQEFPITIKHSQYVWQYACTTEQAKTCKEAVAKYCFATGKKPEHVKASFQLPTN